MSAIAWPEEVVVFAGMKGPQFERDAAAIAQALGKQPPERRS